MVLTWREKVDRGEDAAMGGELPLKERTVIGKDGKSYRVVQGSKKQPTLEDKAMVFIRGLSLVLSKMEQERRQGLLDALRPLFDSGQAHVGSESNDRIEQPRDDRPF